MKISTLLNVLLAAWFVYEMVTLVWTMILMLGMVLLSALWILREAIPSRCRRAYAIGRLNCPVGARRELVYRAIVMSQDPTIGDDEKRWATKRLEALGKPIFYLPPARDDLRVIRARATRS